MGYSYEPMVTLYTIGGILLSHPFEVARTIIQYAGTGSTRKVIGQLYNTEGLAGVYRGLVPRAVSMFPLLMTGTAIANAKEHWGFSFLEVSNKVHRE